MNVLSVQQRPGVVERVWDTARGEWGIFVSYEDVDTAWVRYGEADVTEARRVPVDQLLSSEHPSAGQLAAPEAYHITQTWVGAGLADWARVLWDGQEIAFTDSRRNR